MHIGNFKEDEKIEEQRRQYIKSEKNAIITELSQVNASK